MGTSADCRSHDASGSIAALRQPDHFRTFVEVRSSRPTCFVLGAEFVRNDAVLFEVAERVVR